MKQEDTKKILWYRSTNIYYKLRKAREINNKKLREILKKEGIEFDEF
ncbi:hypothetical protein [Thermococcus prieurii]